MSSHAVPQPAVLDLTEELAAGQGWMRIWFLNLPWVLSFRKSEALWTNSVVINNKPLEGSMQFFYGFMIPQVIRKILYSTSRKVRGWSIIFLFNFFSLVLCFYFTVPCSKCYLLSIFRNFNIVIRPHATLAFVWYKRIINKVFFSQRLTCAKVSLSPSPSNVSFKQPGCFQLQLPSGQLAWWIVKDYGDCRPNSWVGVDIEGSIVCFKTVLPKTG